MLKHLLYMQFVTWYCNGCSIARTTDYANNLIFQDLQTKNDYFTSFDERIYIDLRDSKGYTNEIEKLR